MVHKTYHVMHLPFQHYQTQIVTLRWTATSLSPHVYSEMYCATKVKFPSPSYIIQDES